MKDKSKILSIIFSVVAGALIVAIVVGTILVCLGMRRRTYGHMRYGDIVYARPDFGELDEAFDEAIDEAGSGSRMSAVSAMNNATTLFNELIGALQYASIEYQKDFTDARWSEEYKAVYEQYDKSYVDYCEMMYTALEGPNGSAIFSGYSDAEKQEIRDAYESVTGTGNYVEYRNAIREITAEYNALGSGSGTSVFEKKETARDYATKAGDMLLEMAQLYNDMYPSGYAEEAYRAFGREYTPEDAEVMRDYVKEYLGGYVKELYDSLGDEGIYIYNRVSLNDDLSDSDVVKNYLADVCSSTATDGIGEDMQGYLTEAYDFMREYDLYYRSTSTKGSTGAFTTYLSMYEMPYLFQYVNGSLTETSTFVHEFGHFSSYYINGSYGGVDLDIAEVQSQALEFMFIDRYDELYAGYTATVNGTRYDGSDIAETAAKGDLMNSLLFGVVMGCVMDELQYDVYTNISAYDGGADVTEKFVSVLAEYGLDEEFTARMSADLGYEYDYFNYWWAAVSHTFEQPFYYISYAMSAVPALTIYVDSVSDFTSAAREYNYIQYYGDGSYSFEDLLSLAGVSSPFAESTYEALSSYFTVISEGA